jgi:hypothetical protein
MLFRLSVITVLVAAYGAAAELPERYFKILTAGYEQLEKRLIDQPMADLAALEGQRGRHFTHNVLVAAVLYAKHHRSNPRYHDAKVLALAERLGDLVAADNEKGLFTTRLDHHRDLYMWLEAYRLLEPALSEERRARWRKQLEKNLTALAEDIAVRQDFPAYISPFIGTSPNHYSLWSSTLYLAGRMFKRREWMDLGAKVMHRFAAEEQSPDGYWGEHDVTGPTTGYNFLTLAAVALYWEHSKDKAALEALRRVTEFHKNFTYPDGTPVEVINDRNRTWDVSPWGHFGFSHFPDGRGFAEFLTRHLRQDRASPEFLGRIAQNALYYEEGATALAPQDLANYVYRMKVPAAVRKTGPWVVCLSGLISTQSNSQFYLDRQGHLSIFHSKTGLIITGANSKRQPEVATFWEKADGQVIHMPQASRLRMADDQDHLATAYNTFFSELDVFRPVENQLKFLFTVTPKSRAIDAQLNIQLVLKVGEALETGAGKKVVLGQEKLDLQPQEIGGRIRHRNWTLRVDPSARLIWPVFPFNPYGNARVTSMDGAVGVLSLPVAAKRQPGMLYGQGKQEIAFALEVN